MKILSFNRVKQEELLQKSAQARHRRRYQEAYDFLREALRYGEDAAILSRAAALLNEMGEYGAAVQISSFALTKEKNCEPAQWEMANAFERMWDLDEAIDILTRLDEQKFSGLNLALFKCHLKKCDVGQARKYLFRHSHGADLPAGLKARCDRLEDLLSAGSRSDRASSRSHHAWSRPHRACLSLRGWKWVMHGHRLAHERGEGEFETHLTSNGRAPAGFEGQHYVIARPGFRDCARVLAALQRILAEHSRSYSGIIPLGATAMPVALFLARLLSLPLLNTRPVGGSPLLVMGSNLESRASLPRGFPPRDLLILMKSFERDEFYDAVPPPGNLPEVGRWPEPLRGFPTQWIGALGEMIFLPWERTDKTPRKLPSSAAKEAAWNPSGDVVDPEKAAELLWDHYQKIKR